MSKNISTSDIKVEIGARFKEFVENNFNSIAEFARLLGKDRSFFNPYFTGKSVPGGEILAQLANLGCDLEWLLLGRKISKVKESQEKYDEDTTKVKEPQEKYGKETIVVSKDYFDEIVEKLIDAEVENRRLKEKLNHK